MRMKERKLTNEELQRIDESIIDHASTEWRKVAMVVGLAMTDNQGSFETVPDFFYAERVRLLVEVGRLESQGNLESIRFSEVRLRS